MSNQPGNPLTTVAKSAARALKEIAGAITTDAYTTKLQAQIDQYRKVANIHDLPDIFHYWSNKHLRPRLNEVMGADSIADFYALPFARALALGDGPRRLLSIGAGDCSVEIGVAKRLLELGQKDFELLCLEVSPHLLERAEASIHREALDGAIKLQEADINRWCPDDRFVGVMANHSLHHLVELEQIFAVVYEAIGDRGVFVTNDMIGRNGHMRWPEVLEWVEAIWAFMPDRYKFNHQLKRVEAQFDNWDCSKEGFEGIRAQDILPLLTDRFAFTSFLAYGGIVDLFVDRAFGHNLEPDLPADRAFVDFLQLLNDRLIDVGTIKPTTMFAVMTRQGDGSVRAWRHWTPRYCVREVR
jgi:hypothetical protein